MITKHPQTGCSASFVPKLTDTSKTGEKVEFRQVLYEQP